MQILEEKNGRKWQKMQILEKKKMEENVNFVYKKTIYKKTIRLV